MHLPTHQSMRSIFGGRAALLRLSLLGLTLSLVTVLATQAMAVSPGNASFQRAWQRADQPVTNGLINRTWMWGPEAFTNPLSEPYAESPDGRRAVQYFDKSRMEITNPDAEDDGLWYVTNGLLVVEMMTGKLQLGDTAFEQRQPAQVNVAGDGDDPGSPTYGTFGTVINAPARAEGEPITARLDRSGEISEDSDLVAHGVAAAHFVPETNHTVAAPFWTFMHSDGLVYHDGQYRTDRLFPNPFYATGYPVSEAYWAEVKVAGTFKDVLMQCFERRCLTFTPDNPGGWQVEAGNVGQHYYEWRYGQQPGDGPTPTPDPSVEPSSTPAASPTATSSATPAASPTASPSATPDPSPTPSPSPTPQPTPGPAIDYTYVDAWDTQVHGNAAFDAPVGVAIDPDGNLYIAESGDSAIQHLSPYGELLDGWGEMGTEAGQFLRPEGLAVGPNGTVYVADADTDRVQMFDPSGAYLGTVADATNPGLNAPSDLAINPSEGWLYIVDHLNHRIQRVTLDGGDELTIDGKVTGIGKLSFPNGIGMDAAGNIYVADTAHHSIQIFSPDGQWLNSFGAFGTGPGQFVYPRDVAVSPDGRWIYVVNSGDQNGGASIKVWQRIPESVRNYGFSYEWGVTGAEPGQFSYPARIALDADGNVYVTELLNHRVQKFSPIGVPLDAWSDASRGAFGNPVEIEDGGDDNLYVVDSELAQIKAFTPDGGYVYQWGDQLQYPVDVAVRDGYAYVADQGQNKILRFTAGGEYITTWGGTGSGNGQLNKPEGVAVDEDGYVYVVDNGNYRIQKFTADGQFVKSWGSKGIGAGQFEDAKGIAVHGDTLYVAEPTRVQRFDLDGNHLSEFGKSAGPGQLSNAWAVTVDSEGYIYVPEILNHRIKKYTAEGEFLVSLTSERTGMPGSSAPMGVAVGEDGMLYAVSNQFDSIMVLEPKAN